MNGIIRRRVSGWLPCLAVLAVSAAAGAGELLTITPNSPLDVRFDSPGEIMISTSGDKRLEACRPYLASRIAGNSGWQEERPVYQVIERLAKETVLAASFSHATAEIRIRTDDSGRLHFRGELRSTSTEPIELARFHYLDGLVGDPSPTLLSMRHYELPGRTIRHDDTLPAPLHSNWGWRRLDEPVHRRKNTAISGDSGVIAPDWSSPGFFFGFTGPCSAFGEIGIRTREPRTPFFLAVLLDAVRLDPGESRVLEEAVVSYGDPQDELRHWIHQCRDRLGPARVKPPIAGYCSWYQLGQDVQPADIRRALDGFATMQKPPGGHVIQIDDGYQVMPGDWSGRGAWKDQLNQMPAEIRARGFIPGIWVAPTAIHETHPVVREHPEWLQRDAGGNPCVVFHNWKRFNGRTDARTYFLEPDHPGARAFMIDALRRLRAKGWQYFKIDFAYTVSSARVKHDPSKTTCESLRGQWRLFREALGEDAVINACSGGIWRYQIGVADVSRIGGDIGANIRTLRRNLSEMMLRCHANGIWFQADPDVFYMRAEKSELTPEQSRLLTGTQGLLGTAFLTSDFADQWSPEAREFVSRHWNASRPRVPVMLRLALRPDGLPAAVAAAYDGGQYTAGLYNWSEQAADTTVALSALGIPDTVHTRAATDGTALNGPVIIHHHQPPASLRVIELEQAPTRNPGASPDAGH